MEAKRTDTDAKEGATRRPAPRGPRAGEAAPGGFTARRTIPRRTIQRLLPKNANGQGKNDPAAGGVHGVGTRPQRRRTLCQAAAASHPVGPLAVFVALAGGRG